MHIEMHSRFVKGDPPLMSKLVYSIRSFDLQNVYNHSPKQWFHNTFKHLSDQIKHQLIAYFIDFADKAQSDTLSIKDCIFPFLLGCVVFQLMFMLLSI